MDKHKPHIKPNGMEIPSLYQWLNCEEKKGESYMLFRFLVSKNAYQSYICNYLLDKTNDFPIRKARVRCAEYIENAFLWESTTQGRSYWCNMNNDFEGVIRNITFDSCFSNNPNKYRIWKEAMTNF